MSSDTFVNNNIFETLNTLTGGGIDCNSDDSLQEPDRQAARST